MPSQFVIDREKTFFEICRKAYPYIIHSLDEDFKKELIALMRAIDISNTKQSDEVYELAARAEALIEGHNNIEGSELPQRVNSHYQQVKTLNMQLAELYALAKGKGKRSNKADKELSELKARVETEISDLKARVEQLSAEVLRLSGRPKKLESEPIIIEAGRGLEEEAVTTGDRQLTENPLENLDKKILKYKKFKVYGEKIELYLETHDKIVNKDVQKLFGITNALASYILRKLVKNNVLQKEGAGKSTTYHRQTKKLQENISIETPESKELQENTSLENRLNVVD
ncbi:Uncharacterised protein [uncultured archaeon]|nr:Uncharacterised protein [uncultured archaeon]